MRSSLIAALLVGLLVSPAILPAGDAPVMRAEKANGLSIAFPSQTLYLRQDSGQAEDAVESNH